MSELRNRIIEHYRAHPGVTPHWRTLGTDYDEGRAVFDALFAEGVLEWRTVLSPTGRRMQRIFLTEE